MKIDDYDYIGSAIGNAYFSGLTLEELWECVLIAENREQLDTAVDISIKLKQILKDKE